MNLKELIENTNDKDFITTKDNEFDIIVTCEIIKPLDFEKNSNDLYYRFCNWFYEKTAVIDPKKHLCNYAGLIRSNYNGFKKYSNENWKFIYDDDDEFIREWIKELNSYFANFASEKNYYELLKYLSEKA